jgi:nucleoside-diphosphate-sugar epimerase
MPVKTILILGGGIGGHVAANVLRKQIAREHRVILVDRKRDYVFSPSRGQVCSWLNLFILRIRFSPVKFEHQLFPLAAKGVSKKISTMVCRSG